MDLHLPKAIIQAGRLQFCILIIWLLDRTTQRLPLRGVVLLCEDSDAAHKLDDGTEIVPD